MNCIELPEYQTMQTIYSQLEDDPKKRIMQLDNFAFQIYQINVQAWEIQDGELP